MAYTVLARRYRSGNFDQLIGQEHVGQTLKKAIDSGRIAHAYLFCGTRGTGKTSTARILAKCLNCESAKKPTADPCGKCGSCEGIARGDDIDVIEIDAASNTGVDNVRDLIANASYRPARSRFKVYIIDEVHMLSKAAFNALLKTMEEPPEHVKFILATTEPEKVLPTILSRCQRYDFRNIPTREIADHLKEICKQEKIKADEDALLLVAKAGAGSMRDALSLLDRLLSVGEKELSVEMIEEMLGLPRTQIIFDLAQAIGEGDVKATLTQTDKIVTGGLSPDTLLGSLVDHLRNLLVLRTCGPDSKLVEVPGLSLKDLVAQAGKFDPIILSQDIAILEELRRQIRTSQAGRALIDATFVRLALAEQFNQIGDLLAGKPAASMPAGAVKKKYVEPVGAPPTVKSPVGATLVSPSPRAEEGNTSVAPTSVAAPIAQPSASSVDDEDDDSLPAVGKVWDNSGPSLSELLKQRQSETALEPVAESAGAEPSASAELANIEAVNLKTLPEVWQQLLDVLATKQKMIHSLVVHGKLTAIEDGQATISYEKKHETFVKLFERNGKKDAVREALSEVTGKPLGVRFSVEAASELPSVAAIASPAAASPSPVAAAIARTIEPAPAAPARPIPQAPRREPVRAAVEPPPQQFTPSSAPSVPVVRVTPELKAQLRASEPLINALMDELGADIIKYEPAESSM